MPETIDIYRSHLNIRKDDVYKAFATIISNNLPNNIYLYRINYRRDKEDFEDSRAIVATAKPLTEQRLYEIYDVLTDDNWIHKYYRLEQIYEISDNKIHQMYPFVLFSEPVTKNIYGDSIYLESINVPFESNKPEFIYKLWHSPIEDRPMSTIRDSFYIKLNTPITSDDRLHQIYNEFIEYLNSEGDD